MSVPHPFERPCHRSGLVLVELAVALPFVVLMLAAIMQYGHIFYVHVQLDGATRDACLYATYYPDSDAQIINVAKKGMGRIAMDNPTISVSAESSSRTSGTMSFPKRKPRPSRAFRRSTWQS